jgi:hypothetical protein
MMYSCGVKLAVPSDCTGSTREKLFLGRNTGIGAGRGKDKKMFCSELNTVSARLWGEGTKPYAFKNLALAPLDGGEWAVPRRAHHPEEIRVPEAVTE